MENAQAKESSDENLVTIGSNEKSEAAKCDLKPVANLDDKVRDAIMEIVADQEAQVVIECDIPREHHGEVLGPNHANVRALNHEYGVFITIPRRAVNRAEGAGTGNGGNNEPRVTKAATYRRDVFLIRGKEENCLRAKKALLDLVPRVISVDVPFRFHRAIAGKRGRRARSMCNKYLVSIEIPNPELEKDCVYVRGPARNCEEAKEALLERAKELKDEEDSRETRNDYLSLIYGCFF